jgi:hypothetical protein
LQYRFPWFPIQFHISSSFFWSFVNGLIECHRSAEEQLHLHFDLHCFSTASWCE